MGFLVDAVRGQGYGVVDEGTGKVDRAPHGRIGSVCVDVGGDSQRVTQAAPARLIKVGDEFSKTQQAHTGVEGNRTRDNRPPVGTKAVWTGIGRMEWLVGLQDEVGLAGYPETVAYEVVVEERRTLLIV